MLKVKAPPVMAAPNVIPMADIMLVLLIIFMVITPMLQNKVNVDLAKAVSATPMPDATHEDSTVVSITRDNKVYLGAKQVALDDLGSDAQTELQNKSDKTVYMRADARTHYGLVMDAIDNLRTAGVDGIAFLTEQENPTNTPASKSGKKTPPAPTPATGF